MRILIVEDDPVIAGQIGRGLGALGYETDLADCADAAFRQIASKHFDAMVLDRMLPDLSGTEMLARLHCSAVRPPTLILSALGSVHDRIEGLEAGAEDYLVKPFDMAELSARLNVIVRRGSAGNSPENLAVGKLSLDPASHSARFGEVKVDLNRKQYSLLAHLMRSVDRLVTRGMLLENVWGYSFQPSTNIVESNMSRLRTKLLELGCDPIETQRGAGYILRADRCN